MTLTTRPSKVLPGEWVKGKMIGSGSFGHVHIAMSKTNGHLFVVKSSKSAVGWKSLENEAEILMNLRNSRCFVKWLGKEIESNGEYLLNIFLEHVGGGSIYDIVNKFGGQLSEEVICSYAKQILISLQYLHEKGIVHCDVKCKNVLLDSHGNVKLADFGCSKKVDILRKKDKSLSFRQHVGLGGTPLWMAPEVLKGERLDYSANIWSLGCTIIEMATGKPPSWGNNNNNIMSDNPMTTVLNIIKCKEMPQLLENLSENGLDFIKRCLQRNPKKRWTAQELLFHPFLLDNDNRDLNMKLVNNDYQDAYSLASVLDVGKLDMDFIDSDHEKDTNCSEINKSSLLNRGLVSMNNQVERKELDGSFLRCKPYLEIPGNWIVVRAN